MASDFGEDVVSLAPTMAPPDPLIGTIIEGKYQIKRLLGAGGMGAVYEASHRVIGKRVAVKVLHREFTGSADIVQRFQREARAATAIGHPHIVEVFDMGTMAGGGFFQVLELLEGTSLADELDAKGPLSYARAVHILSQVSDALAATHEKGVVHRDLKPDNVFLVQRGDDPDFVKLLDFGVAKILDANTGAKTRTGMAIGTPSYMSPEQAQGANDIDHRTDVFALGVMTFEILAGVRPFDADTFAMTIFQLCMADTPELSGYRDDVPQGLQAVLVRMLEKKKEHRYASCRDVKAALAPFASLSAAPRLRGAPPERVPIPISAIKRIAADERAAEPAGEIGYAKTITPSPSATPIAAPSALVTGPPIAAPSALVTGPLAPLRADELPPVVTPPVVDAALPSATPASAAAEAPPVAAATPSPVSVATSAVVDVTQSPPSSAPSRAGLFVGIGAVVLVAIALGLFALRTAPPAPPPEVVRDEAPAAVRVSLRVEPLRAELFVDEARVTNPYVIELPRSTEAHMIEARLEGYTTVQRAVTFDAPVDLTLALAPLAAVTAPAPTPEVEAPSVAPAHGRSHPTEVRPTIEARPSTPDAPVATSPTPAPEPAPPQALKTVVF